MYEAYRIGVDDDFIRPRHLESTEEERRCWPSLLSSVTPVLRCFSIFSFTDSWPSSPMGSSSNFLRNS